MLISATLQRSGLVVACALWACLVMSGSLVMLAYATTPGAGGEPPLTWPEDSSIQRTYGTNTLLLFAHPHCPCTDATFEQLLRALTSAKQPVDCHIIFTIPEETEPGWEDGSLLRRAEATSALIVHRDERAVETKRFDVATSGHVLLYGPSGRLEFSGGITPSRGHEGDSVGLDALQELLCGMQPISVYPPVYGCPLLNETDPATPVDCCAEGAACHK